MSEPGTIPQSILEFLRSTDTCTVSNAIETFDVRMRNEGYIHGGVRCIFPELQPVAGYAITGRIRTTVPPVIWNHCYYNSPEWWDYVASLPGPKIMAIAEADDAHGTGAFFGQIHMEIARALGCVAYVSNGAVRDLPALKEAKFPCFAAGVSPSHAYAHIIEFGEPIEIGSLKISSGDLLHADCHGVQNIPAELAGELQARVAQVLAREAELIDLCRSQDFSSGRLKDALARSDTFQPVFERESIPRNGTETR